MFVCIVTITHHHPCKNIAIFAIIYNYKMLFFYGMLMTVWFIRLHPHELWFVRLWGSNHLLVWFKSAVCGRQGRGGTKPLQCCWWQTAAERRRGVPVWQAVVSYKYYFCGKKKISINRKKKIVAKNVNIDSIAMTLIPTSICLYIHCILYTLYIIYFHCFGSSNGLITDSTFDATTLWCPF